MTTHSSFFLPGEFHGQRNLVGYSPWRRESWTRLSYLDCYVTWCQLLNLSVSWIQHQSGSLPEEPVCTLKSSDWGSSKRRLFAKMQAELKDPHKEWWSISELETVQALSLWAWDGGQAEESFHRAWRVVTAVGKSCLEGAVTFNGRLQPIQVLAGKELEQ